jgi:hypothetical protein
MRTIKQFVLASLACLIGSTAFAATPKGPGVLDNESGLTYNKSIPLNLNSYGIDQLAVQVSYSTPAVSALVFTDGSQSTMSITINSNTGISSATATDFLTVLSTNSLSNACITFFNGSTTQRACNGGWRIDVTSDTAADITTQMNGLFTGIISSNAISASVVTSTATQFGTAGNNMTLSSNSSSITVNSANFSGGQDGTEIGIGPVTYKFGVNVTVGASASASATNLATAISASSNTYGVQAQAIGAVVTATSTLVGTNQNYATFSSSQTPATLAPYISSSNVTGQATGAMFGGTNSSYQLNGEIISTTTIPAYFWPVNTTPMIALPVLYTNSGQALTGLTTGTTYYLIPNTPSSYGLSTTSTGALAGYNALPVISTTNGTFIQLASTQAKSTADTFTLTPSSYTATTTLAWQVSNDCTNWSTYASSGTTTLVTPTAAIQTLNSDFGTVNFRCIQAVVNRTGNSWSTGMAVDIIINGKNSGL